MDPCRSALSRPVALGIVALLVLVWAVYHPILHHDFLEYDDDVTVTMNRNLTADRPLEAVRWAFTTLYAANWVPVTWLSHLLDVRLFGFEAGGHHLVSLLLHGANAILLFLALLTLTGSAWRSFFVASLFAVHPLNVEPVAWVTARRDLLCAFFWFLTILAYHSYTRSAGAVRYLLFLSCFSLGLMSKPMIVTLPLGLLLLDLWPLGRVGGKEAIFGRPGDGSAAKRLRLLALEKAPLFALSAALSVVTIIAQSKSGAAVGTEAIPVSQRLGNALVSYAVYLKQTFWPAGLAVYYPHPGVQLPFRHVLFAAIALGVVTAIVIRLRRQGPYLPTGWLWYLATLLPVIGLLQVGQQARADRYAYVSVVGIFVMAVWAAGALSLRWRLTRAAAATGFAIVAALAAVSGTQVRHWRNTATLFQHALAVTRNNHIAHNNLGTAFLNRGELSEAYGHFQEALRISPANDKAHTNMGNVLARQGHHEKALTHLMVAVQQNPGNLKAHGLLGKSLAALGRPDEGIYYFQRALKIDPQSIETLVNFGNALVQSGRFLEAIRYYEEALRLDPTFAVAHFNLGATYYQTNRWDKAQWHYQRALELKPDYVQARENLLDLLRRSAPEAGR